MNERERKRALQERDFAVERGLRKAIETAEGRAMLWWIIGLGQIYADAYSDNPLAMARRTGEQSVALRVLDRLLKINQSVYVQMQQESQMGMAKQVQASDDEEDAA